VPTRAALDGNGSDPEFRLARRRLRLALVLGLPLIGLGVADTLGDVTAGSPLDRKILLSAQAVLCTLIVAVCGGTFCARAWRAVRTRRPEMDALIGVGAVAAYVYSCTALAYIWLDTNPLQESPTVPGLAADVHGGVQLVAPRLRAGIEPFFESAGMIVLLALLGRVLELRARQRSEKAIRQLLPLIPTTATVILADNREEERPLEEVRPGDLVRVRPGQRIPVDGVIRDGATTVDESVLTGETVRAERGSGGRVLAGSENGLRAITVAVTGVRDQTVLGQVIAIVGRARESRVTRQRTLDRVAAWYIPLALAAAATTFVGWAVFGPAGSALTYASVCAVAVLIVACPCAIGLATPTATVVGMERAARAGVLFRDPATLERLSAVDTVLFDKTGTLTEGRPRLAGVVANVGLSEGEVLAAAAAVERGSEHPIALAIVWEAAKRGIAIPVAEGVEAVLGKGIRGRVEGRQVAVGRLNFLMESGAHREAMISEATSQRVRGHVVVFVGAADRCIGLIVMSDPLRAGAREGVGRLAAAGLRLAVVTGDHADSAGGIARLVGITEVVADTLPAEKYAVVLKLKGEGRVVAMCGDGVNDAPALAAADVGIAVSTGTQAAIGTAGVTLTGTDLGAIDSARHLSRAVVRTVRQNLVLAFAFNLLAVPVAAGLLVPLGGGLIDSIWASATIVASSLLVIANSVRLARRRV
jgi:Cu+-exporting ATPase